jgi:hypothetical protein
MKRNITKLHSAGRPTLGDLIVTINELTHNQRLSALIVADMINSRQVRLEGNFHGRRVVVA